MPGTRQGFGSEMAPKKTRPQTKNCVLCMSDVNQYGNNTQDCVFGGKYTAFPNGFKGTFQCVTSDGKEKKALCEGAVIMVLLQGCGSDWGALTALIEALVQAQWLAQHSSPAQALF